MFCHGHPEGGQPVPHPGFENQRFPKAVRRYLGGPGPPFPADLGDPGGGPGRNKTYLFSIASKNQPRKSEAPHGLPSKNRDSVCRMGQKKELQCGRDLHLLCQRLSMAVRALPLLKPIQTLLKPIKNLLKPY